MKSACRKSTNVALPERAQKSLIREESSVLIGLFFRGTISAIDYSAYAQPGQSYLSFNQEAENDADLFFSNLSTFDWFLLKQIYFCSKSLEKRFIENFFQNVAKSIELPPSPVLQIALCCGSQI